MKKLIILILVFILMGCNCKNDDSSNSENSAASSKPVLKKYTNADFYVDGKLSAEKTLAAYKELFDYYGYPYDQSLMDNMFITDFGLSDFVNVGMAGVFWVNNSTEGYFAHDIYLLPGQMIVEHKHVKTEFPPKMESWRTIYGTAYNFGEVGESENGPSIPVSQNKHITVSKYNKTESGQIAHLNRVEASHFMLGGKEGCIVAEYATYHDGNGLRFTNPNVVFSDILGNN